MILSWGDTAAARARAGRRHFRPRIPSFQRLAAPFPGLSPFLADGLERVVGRSKPFFLGQDLSRPERPRGQRDHRQKSAERHKLGEITQRLNSDSLHHGLLDHDKNMICSFSVLVNRMPAFAIGGVARFAAGFGRASAWSPSNCRPRHCQCLARVLKAEEHRRRGGSNDSLAQARPNLNVRCVRARLGVARLGAVDQRLA